jgi:hypothetical protein
VGIQEWTPCSNVTTTRSKSGKQLLTTKKDVDQNAHTTTLTKVIVSIAEGAKENAKATK